MTVLSYLNQIEIAFRFERRNGGDHNERSEFFVASPFRRNPCFNGNCSYSMLDMLLGIISLNPCFNGNCSILMLRITWTCYGLNPCFNGNCSSAYIFCCFGIYGLNPCFNGNCSWLLTKCCIIVS